ncbi:MAG: DNA primase [Candidatus Omnitrophica bacterium]|nr:DNA primase [Candidatus Omnitrophota bacterium]
MIPSEKLDEIIEKTDIVEVVSKYVNLKKSGRNFRGLCPFHPENTPSFFVSPEKQIFHCFGCGVGGNVINFLMRIENIGFGEAVRIAAEISGVEISSYQNIFENDESKKVIFEANRIAKEFFSSFLQTGSGTIAIDFLERRGIDKENWEKFGLGYVPSGNVLTSYILEKKLRIDDFEQAGLITRKEAGYADVFKHRIMIPIFDHRNNIVGFGARAIDDIQQPKYLNSHENSVFKKGNLFFGLNLAKERIKSVGFSIVVEGYFDLIKMHIAGFDNTIAPLGTAITENHLRLLKRWSNKILLVFDSDSAGTAAAFRSLETILASGFEVKIGVMPSGFDPEDFLDNYGPDALKKLLNQSKDFVDFALYIGSQKYSAQTPKGKSEMITEILGLIKNIPDEIERTIRVKELAKTTGIDSDILLKQIELLPDKKNLSYYSKEKISFVEQTAAENAEKTLIKILLNQPDWAGEIYGCYNLLPESVQAAMEYCYRKDVSETSIPKLLNQLKNPEQASLLTQFLMNETIQMKPEITRKVFYDCVGILCRKFYEKRAKQLKEIIKTKMESNQPCEKELEELNTCINLTTIKNIEFFIENRKEI